MTASPILRLLGTNPLLVLVLALGLMGCQSTNVVVDYDTNANFENLKHYDWLKETSGSEEGFDPLIAERVEKAVKVQLDSVPLTLTSTPDQTDILVRYFVGTYTRSKPSNSGGSIGLGSGGGHTAIGISLSFPLGGDKVVKEAQIVVDFVNPTDKKLMWRGTNRINISDDNPTKITEMINAAVAEIFSQFPPGKAAN